MKVDGLKGNHRLCNAIQALAGRVEGVEGISASVITGSVLICYDRTKPQVLQRLQAMVGDAEALLETMGRDPDAFPGWPASQGPQS